MNPYLYMFLIPFIGAALVYILCKLCSDKYGLSPVQENYPRSDEAARQPYVITTSTRQVFQPSDPRQGEQPPRTRPAQDILYVDLPVAVSSTQVNSRAAMGGRRGTSSADDNARVSRQHPPAIAESPPPYPNEDPPPYWATLQNEVQRLLVETRTANQPLESASR
ncbi:uncharacterized protein [Periplaneta americana]|uniref:uncharacterized protein n=1 Tax=Periplaneta americana TaxID=6978 RepID=UPI0037E7896D